MKTWALPGIAMGLALTAPALLAQPKTASPHSSTMAKKASSRSPHSRSDSFTMTLKNTPFQSALKALFQNRSAGYVIETEVANADLMVNATFKNLPFEMALNTVARSVGVRVAKQQAGNQPIYTFSMKSAWTPETMPSHSSLQGRSRFVTHERSDGSIVRSPVQGTDRVTLTVKNSVIRDALDALFLNRGASYVLDPDVVAANPIINAQIRDMPFELALQTMARSAGLQVTKQNGVYTLTLRKT